MALFVLPLVPSQPLVLTERRQEPVGDGGDGLGSDGGLGDDTGQEVWPAGLALAWSIAQGGLSLPARGTLLDLGCGTGLVALAAAQAAAHVPVQPSTIDATITAGDGEPAALALALANAGRNGLDRVITCTQMDWRDPPTQRWDRIAVADGLYVESANRPLARFLAMALAPGGEAWVADPGRWTARHFPYHAAEAGLALVEERDLPVPFTAEHGPLRLVDPDLRPGPLTVRLWRLRRMEPHG